jgi:hypothetical protein
MIPSTDLSHDRTIILAFGWAVAFLFVLWFACAGCESRRPAAATASLNEVIVMGMIHDEHRTSEAYGIDVVQQIIRRIEPDYVLCEIPPDRLAAALEGFRATGQVTEPRVSRFPEYTDALFPLTREMRFEIIPCAAWTQPTADARVATLKRMEIERPEDYAESSESMDWIPAKLKAEGLSDDPGHIHAAHYDSIVQTGMAPYNRLFNDALGPSGWENINVAHYARITAALDAHRGEGKRVLIMFGAWHKHWFLERLRQRGDIKIRPLTDFLESEPAGNEEVQGAG